MPPHREALKTSTLDRILRIYQNSPDFEEQEALQTCTEEVAKFWNSKIPRDHNCEELNDVTYKI